MAEARGRGGWLVVMVLVVRFAFQDHPSIYCIKMDQGGPERRLLQWSGHEVMGAWPGGRDKQGCGEPAGLQTH